MYIKIEAACAGARAVWGIFMKRIIDYHLLEWKSRHNRKPLLLRGARQVGKTHAVRELGKTFKHFVEVNLELDQVAKDIIERDMDPHRIVRQLFEHKQKQIIPGSTLLFFDEIQNSSTTITTLRYFYELMPELHVIAAGSLLDFAIEQVGVPVGRVSTFYMYPMSFLEFLVAHGYGGWAKLIIERAVSDEPLSEPHHQKLLDMVGEYLAIGGMPEAVNEWVSKSKSRTAKVVHTELLFNYEQDFGKYAKRHQIKYLGLIFNKTGEQLGGKFMFSRVGEYKKRELDEPLELLQRAGLLYKIMASSGQGIPVGAHIKANDFKVIFLDVGLTQALLKLDITPWFAAPLTAFVNKGALVEAFVGQEILAYSDPISKESLFYWRKDERASHAEIDYLVQLKEKVVPIEVKAGKSKRIKSMQIFLDSHPNSVYGLRFSTDQYGVYNSVYSYPLYAIAKPFLDDSEDLHAALKYLVKK